MTTAGRLKLVVFDCDGTLVDSQHSIVLAMRSAWRAHGLPEPDALAVRRVVGLSLAEAVAALAPRETGVEHESLAEAYRAAYTDLRQRGEHEEALFPGVCEMLEELERASFLLGVATGKSRRGIRNTLASHGLTGRFVTVQSGDEGPGKPHPHMLRKAMAEAGVEPADTVVVGDTVFDVRMARNADVAAIGVGWGYHEEEELRAAGAHCVIHSFAELPSVLAGLDAAR
jgi:phosphoglycolate phosphatase